MEGRRAAGRKGCGDMTRNRLNMMRKRAANRLRLVEWDRNTGAKDRLEDLCACLDAEDADGLPDAMAELLDPRDIEVWR